MQIIITKNNEKGYDYSIPDSQCTILLDDTVPPGEKGILYAVGEELVIKPDTEPPPEKSIKKCTFVNNGGIITTKKNVRIMASNS